MDEFIKQDSVEVYSKLLGVETLYPSVNMIEFFSASNSLALSEELWFLCYIL